MRYASALAICAVLGLAAAAPAPSGSPYASILRLEAQRSLGAGELAGYLASSDTRLAARAALAIGRTRLAAGAPLLAGHALDARVPVRALSICVWSMSSVVTSRVATSASDSAAASKSPPAASARARWMRTRTRSR